MCGRKYDGEVAAREREVYLGRRNFGPHLRRGLKLMFEQMTQGKPAPNQDIRPTNEHFVLRAEDDETTPELMTWGFQPEWSRMILINSRADKLDGRVWGKAFGERRCLIPVGGFYEWTGPKGKRQPHSISNADGSPMLLGGLWVEHNGLNCYSIITTDATSWMAKLHNRQPLMLTPEQATGYLADEGEAWRLVEAAAHEALTEIACAPLAKDRPPVPLASESAPVTANPKRGKKSEGGPGLL